MHKVVIAPDSFKGVLSAREVCDIISYKINRHYPFCQIVKVPVADGGEGSIEAFLCAKNGKKTFFAFFFVNVYECEQKFIFTDKNIDKVNKKK